MCFKLLVNKCAWTSQDNKNPLLHPIFVTLSNKNAMQQVKKLLQESFEKIDVQEDYHEIYVKDNYYGITLTFITDEGGTTITAYVHNKKHPYHNKKYLINFLKPIREKFKEFIRN